MESHVESGALMLTSSQVFFKVLVNTILYLRTLPECLERVSMLGVLSTLR